MSPRRRIDPDEPEYFVVATPDAKEPVRWGLPVAALVSALVIAVTIASGVFMLVRHRIDVGSQAKDADALAYVTAFMTGYTTLDPFHANAYADRVLAQATGDFAKTFKERENEVVVQVARAEPTAGSVISAGVQRWNDNGSLDVLVATKITTRTPDGKSTIESGNRWVITTTREGQQWKISQLIQVI